MKLHTSGEAYLKAIYILIKERGTVRSLDVAERMGVSKPSVSRAVKLLHEGGFLRASRGGFCGAVPDRTKHPVQRIEVYFNYIGKFENELTKEIEPTEQEMIQMREEIEEAKKEKSRAYHREYSKEY